MLADPLSQLFQKIPLPWFVIVFLYALLDISVNAIYLHKRKELKKTFREDYLLILWPLLILVPVVSLFFYVSNVSLELNAHLHSLGRTDIYLFGKNAKKIWALMGFVALAHTGMSYYRYQKLDHDTPDEKKRFFTRNPRFHLLRVILFDLPMAFMILVLSVRVLEHSFIIHRLLSTLSSPSSFLYPPDGMYGYKWIYDIIMTYFVVGILLSFVPGIMLIREKNTSYSKVYIAGIVFLELAVIASFGLLTYDFHMTIQSICYHFLYQLSPMVVTNAEIIRKMPATDISRQEIYLNLYNLLQELPCGFHIPEWLKGILGVRLITYIFEIYPLIPQSIQKRLPILPFLEKFLGPFLQSVEAASRKKTA